MVSWFGRTFSLHSSGKVDVDPQTTRVAVAAREERTEPSGTPLRVGRTVMATSRGPTVAIHITVLVLGATFFSLLYPDSPESKREGGQSLLVVTPDQADLVATLFPTCPRFACRELMHACSRRVRQHARWTRTRPFLSQSFTVRLSSSRIQCNAPLISRRAPLQHSRGWPFYACHLVPASVIPHYWETDRDSRSNDCSSHVLVPGNSSESDHSPSGGLRQVRRAQRHNPAVSLVLPARTLAQFLGPKSTSSALSSWACGLRLCFCFLPRCSIFARSIDTNGHRKQVNRAI